MEFFKFSPEVSEKGVVYIYSQIVLMLLCFLECFFGVFLILFCLLFTGKVFFLFFSKEFSYIVIETLRIFSTNNL